MAAHIALNDDFLNDFLSAPPLKDALLKEALLKDPNLKEALLKELFFSAERPE
jgi:hypothetical protein